MEHPPPCCASCPELSPASRSCRLLAEPVLANRTRVLTMPCDVRRLIRLRMRAHGDDVVSEALARWESADTAIESLIANRENAPIDARLWLTRWPLGFIADRVEAKVTSQPGIPNGVAIGASLPPNEAPILLALARLQRIDAVGFALLCERLNRDFDPLSWRPALADSDSGLEDRIVVALFRVLVLRTNILEQITDPRARVCLAARRFRSGERSDFAALRAARRELGEPELSMPALRILDQQGVLSALELLAAEPLFHVVLTEDVLARFRQVLRVDDADGGVAPGELYIEPLLALIAREVEAAQLRTADGHPALVDIGLFAAGNAPRDVALSHVEHLLACRDRRCTHVYRGEVCGQEAVSRALSGPMSEPPPPIQGAPPVPIASPRMIRCRDVLWETFAAMAHDEGRPIDDLVEEAMDRYRSLRSHLKNAGHLESTPDPLSVPLPHVSVPSSSSVPSAATSSTRGRSSRPPPSGSARTGLRLGPPSAPPPPPPREDVDTVVRPTNGGSIDAHEETTTVDAKVGAPEPPVSTPPTERSGDSPKK